MFTQFMFPGNLARLGTCMLFILAFCLTNQTKACDRTSFTLDSIVAVGSEYDIHTTMRVGGGITGSSKGAANNTAAFGFGFFSCQSNFRVSSFPPLLVSDTTKVPAYGYDVGPGFFGTQGFIFYQTYGYYTCVSNTAYCGLNHTDVTEITFRVPVLPDSIMAYGLEGAGNPFVGCFGNSDMIIDFGAMAFDCSSEPAPQEEGHSFLLPQSIRESMPSFLSQGYTPSAAEADPNSHTTVTGLEDQNLQVDLKVFPNPNNGNFNIRVEGLIQAESEVLIYNITGKEMARKTVSSGVQQVEMNLDNLSPGMYMARMEGPTGKIVRRFNVVK